MNLPEEYASIRKQATALAGEPSDIVQRAVFLHELYIDSGCNHTFPMVALHGALWAKGYFETTGTLGKAISYRYMHNRKEREFRHGMLEKFSNSFKDANRQVFIDTYTNYHFTKTHRYQLGAERLIGQQLLGSLRRVHQAREHGIILEKKERKEAFTNALQWEQESTVAPAIEKALAEFDCPILRRLCLMPVVKFGYFPPMYRMFFSNFSDKKERIDKAIHAHDIAERSGFPFLFRTMRSYNALPEAFFENYESYTKQLRDAKTQ